MAPRGYASSAMLRHAAFVLFFASAFVFGCSSSSSGDNGNADASDASGDAIDSGVDTYVSGPPADTAPDDVYDAGCNGVTNVALEVVEQDVAKAMPLPGGGPIPDGVYVVTAITHFTGVGGHAGPGTFTTEETIMIVGGVLVQGVEKVKPNPGRAFTADIGPYAANLKWKEKCPASAPAETYGYDTDATSLVLYDTVKKTAKTYTRKNLTPGP